MKTRSLKSRKIDIFPKGLTHVFGHLSNFFFLGNIGKENVFDDILARKHAFLGYKNKKFKKSKMPIFPKGLTHGFSPKMTIFSTFLVEAI